MQNSARDCTKKNLRRRFHEEKRLKKLHKTQFHEANSECTNKRLQRFQRSSKVRTIKEKDSTAKKLKHLARWKNTFAEAKAKARVGLKVLRWMHDQSFIDCDPCAIVACCEFMLQLKEHVDCTSTFLKLSGLLAERLRTQRIDAKTSQNYSRFFTSSRNLGVASKNLYRGMLIDCERLVGKPNFKAQDIAQIIKNASALVHPIKAEEFAPLLEAFLKKTPSMNEYRLVVDVGMILETSTRLASPLQLNYLRTLLAEVTSALENLLKLYSVKRPKNARIRSAYRAFNIVKDKTQACGAVDNALWIKFLGFEQALRRLFESSQQG